MKSENFKTRVRLRHLDCFVCVADTGHLGRAAARLRLTQPAVSKTLNELEELTGLKLLVRSRTGSTLTADGTNFLLHARAVLDALHAAQDSVSPKTMTEPEVVRIGALPTVAPDLLPEALETFRLALPHTRVEVHTGTNAALIGLLRSGEIACALARIAEPETMLGLGFELLYVDVMVLAVRPKHPLLQRASVTAREIADFPMVVLAKGTIPHHGAESYFRAHGLALPKARVETLSMSLARQLGRGGDSVLLVPHGAVRHDLETGVLTRLAVPIRGTEEPVGLLLRDLPAAGSATTTLMAALRSAAYGRR